MLASVTDREVRQLASDLALVARKSRRDGRWTLTDRDRCRLTPESGLDLAEALELLRDRARGRAVYQTDKAEAVKLAVAGVTSPWIDGTEPDAIYPQECYCRAYRYATDLARFEVQDGMHLVHGECDLAFGGHAWVELPNDLVFDGVYQSFFRRADWYAEFHAFPWYKYTPHAALLISCRVNGPRITDFMYVWDGLLGLPLACAPDDPLVIDLPQAEELLRGKGL